MSLQRLRANLSVGNSARLILATTGPLQIIFDKPGMTHAFCNRQATAILQHDGFDHYSAVCQSYMKELNAGVTWADKGWKNVGHYLNTNSTGLWRFPNAIDDFRGYFGQAFRQVRRGDNARAMFFLGAAAHLVQDLCVPHHARGKILSGHHQYETWAASHHGNYAVESGGIYQEGQAAQLFLHRNAAIASEYLESVDAEATETAYHQATQILLPQAQLTTAGLFHQFLATVGATFLAA